MVFSLLLSFVDGLFPLLNLPIKMYASKLKASCRRAAVSFGPVAVLFGVKFACSMTQLINSAFADCYSTNKHLGPLVGHRYQLNADFAERLNDKTLILLRCRVVQITPPVCRKALVNFQNTGLAYVTYVEATSDT